MLFCEMLEDVTSVTAMITVICVHGDTVVNRNFASCDEKTRIGLELSSS